MGLFDFLSPQVPTPPVTQTNALTLSGPLQKIVKQGTSIAQNLIKNPPSLPPVAPFDPLQTQGQSAYLNAASGPISNLVGNTTGTQNLLLDPNFLLNPNSPQLQGYINAATEPITRNYTTNVLPGSQIEAIGNTGLGGGSRAGVREANDAASYLTALGNTTAPIALGAYNKGLDVLGNAVNQAPTTAGFNLLPGSIYDVVGNQRRDLIQQQQETDLINKFLPFLVAQDVTQYASGVPGAVTGTSTVNPAYPQANPQASAIGTGGTIGRLAGGVLGSIFPGVGTAAGAALGGIGGSLLGAIFG